VRQVNPLDLVETIREGLLVLEPDRTVRFANRCFCDTFAVAPEDTVGRKLHELVTNAVKYAFPDRDKGLGRGDAKAHSRTASPDGLR
jgi:sensor histidine kinase regulating citrate/malate metabolism